MKAPEREKIMSFSKVNIITIWGQLYVQNKSRIENILDINKKNIAVMKNDINGQHFQELCRKFNVDPNIIYYDDFESIFQAIETAQVQGGVVTSTFGLTHKAEHNVKQSSIMFSPSELYFATLKNKNIQVLDQIDAAVTIWKDNPESSYYKFLNRWMNDSRLSIEKVPPWMIYLLTSTVSILILGLIISLLARLKNQKERLSLQNQLAHSQKMESIGNLAGGIAHDFNNLLTIIRGNAELLQFNPSIDANDKESTKQIIHACDNASFLTSQLLTFSRKTITQEKVLDVNQLIQNSMKMFKRFISENISLILDLSESNLNIKIDQNQFLQIMMNIIINSRDALIDGGQITICTRNLSKDDRSLPKELNKQKKYVLISIKDNGIGMDKDIQEKIFDPFFSTKAIGKGTGLGMSVVYGIINNLNGHLEVVSAPLKGTEIRIYLPECDEEQTETLLKESILARDKFKGRSKSVLLIEDDPEVLKYTEKLLHKYEMNIILATNTEEAKEQYHKHKKDITLIICDVILTDGNGIELINDLVEKESSMKVLFYSGYSEEKSQKEIILNRGFSFLQKPFEAKELISQIQEMLS